MAQHGFSHARLSQIYRWSRLLIVFIALSLLVFVLQAPAHAAQAFPPFATTQQARAAEHGTVDLKLRSLAGVFAFLAITFVFGRLRRTGIPVVWRTIAGGVAIQFLFAWLVLDTLPGRWFFDFVAAGVNDLLDYASQGARFLFGNLVQTNVPVGIPVGDPASGPIPKPTAYANTGAYFAFTVLPTIIFFSTLSTLAFYFGVMQRIVGAVARFMQWTMKTSGMETVAVTANIFVGQTEAPLMVKPYIATATKSELMAVMVAGFANIASGVLAAYTGMLRPYFPDVAGHLLAASIISAPSSLAIAKLLLPEGEESQTAGKVKIEVERNDVNAIDATTRGALEGLQLALNVGAVLIVFIAMIALINALIGWGGARVGVHGLSLEKILGWIATPLAWLTGMPWHDARAIGPLLGIKTALNEFVAYLQLSQILASNPSFASPRSVIIAVYALCGFANFSSVAIQIGGISGMAPNRRHDLSRLALTAMWGGAISSLVSACVVGVLL